MGAIASKYAFQPPTPSKSYLQDEMLLKTSNDTFIPFVTYKHKDAQYTIIFSHGNACDMGGVDSICKKISEKLLVNVVSYDYEGYGHSQNCKNSSPLYPSEEGCYRGAKTIANYVFNYMKIPYHRQIWIGESIGSGPTVDAVYNLCNNLQPVAAMILISPFWSATSLVSFPLSYLYDMFPNGKKISSIDVPVLLLHGDCDTVVPPVHSEWLQKAAKNCQRVLLEDTDHNQVWQNEKIIFELEQFISNLD